MIFEKLISSGIVEMIFRSINFIKSYIIFKHILVNSTNKQL